MAVASIILQANWPTSPYIDSCTQVSMHMMYKKYGYIGNHPNFANKFLICKFLMIYRMAGSDCNWQDFFVSKVLELEALFMQSKQG